MWVTRQYLENVELSCKADHMTQDTTVVQDRNTTVQRIVERAASGVVNPDSLRNAGFTYEDIGIPTNMSVFDRLDLLRNNAQRIEHLSEDLRVQNTQPSEPPAQPSEPPAPSA